MHPAIGRKIFLFLHHQPHHKVYTSPNAALQSCHNAPLIVMAKNRGICTYSANDCKENWETQDIRLDFA